MTNPTIILASASPRRRELLTLVGIPHQVDPADVDETVHRGERPEVYVERLAREKAAVVATRHAGAVVIAADTTVVHDGEILGKPESAADAQAMLARLSGHTHEVYTGMAVIVGDRVASAVERVEVTFRDLSDGDIRAYVATGEPMDKAGGYHVDGRGALFITSVSGSPSNVAGLPVRLLLRLAREAGVDLGLV